MSDKKKPITPYVRLKDAFREFAFSVVSPHRRVMFMFPESRIYEEWRLDDLWHRTLAAQQLGYEVKLEAVPGEGLKVMYVKARPTDIPWEAKL